MDFAGEWRGDFEVVSLLLLEEKLSEMGFALENCEVGEMVAMGSCDCGCEADGGMATFMDGAIEGSAYAPSVGAVMAAEPNRGSKELSMDSLLLHQRHIMAGGLGVDGF